MLKTQEVSNEVLNLENELMDSFILQIKKISKSWFIHGYEPEDLLQESILEFYKHRGDTRIVNETDYKKILKYLFACAINHFKKLRTRMINKSREYRNYTKVHKFNKKSSGEEVEIPFLSEDFDIYNNPETKEIITVIREKLNSQDFLIFLMKFSDYSIEEISSHLKFSVATIHLRLNYIRREINQIDFILERVCFRCEKFLNNLGFCEDCDYESIEICEDCDSEIDEDGLCPKCSYDYICEDCGQSNFDVEWTCLTCQESKTNGKILDEEPSKCNIKITVC